MVIPEIRSVILKTPGTWNVNEDGFMKQRIITACWLIPLAVLWMFAAPAQLFAAGAVILVLLGAWEWGKFVCPGKLWAYASLVAALLGVSFCFCNPFLRDNTVSFYSHPAPAGLLGMGAAWWILAFVLVIKYPADRNLLENRFMTGILGLVTLLPFFWSLLVLHQSGTATNLLPFEQGSANLFFVMLLVWCADSGAYFTGKFLGRHHMIPQVSPNKTWEGLAGGVALALIVAFGATSFMESHWNALYLALSVVLAVGASVVGDLAESMFKRIAGIKDSSNLLPGHGGVLDRIDSLTAALPVYAFVLFLCSRIGG